MFPAEVTQGDAVSAHTANKGLFGTVQCCIFRIFVLLLFKMAFKHSAKVLAPKHRALMSL